MVVLLSTIIIAFWLVVLIWRGMAEERKSYNTTIRADLMKQVKLLAVEEDRRQNDLLEEAIKDLLKKYDRPVPR